MEIVLLVVLIPLNGAFAMSEIALSPYAAHAWRSWPRTATAPSWSRWYCMTSWRGFSRPSRSASPPGCFTTCNT